MTLLEKLHKVYEEVERVEKRGKNTGQHYDYVKAADVTNAIRKQLTQLRVYAEINFDFAGSPYTIARASAPNAPFSAVNVKCSAIFHDLDSGETSTASGLGSGADTGDKAAYKAMTGALKYALKNAFLVPDEADPEADSTVDETPESSSYPDYEELPPSTPKERRGATLSTAAPSTSQRAFQAPREPGDEGPATTPETFSKELDAEAAARPPLSPLPTEDQMNDYRKRFKQLADELSAKKALKTSPGLVVNRKLTVFLQNTEKVEAAKFLTVQQWDDFFSRVDTIKTKENGLVSLGILINRANGIEADTKKKK